MDMGKGNVLGNAATLILRGNKSLPTNVARSDTGTEFYTPKYVRGADGSRDSSVSIVTRLQAGKLRELSSTPSSGKEISLDLSLHTRTGAHRSFFLIRPSDKRAGV
jgi:hypothetical protein